MLGLPIAELVHRTYESFQEARNFIPRSAPLVLDLDGDGIETVAAGQHILFDHDGDGIKHASGWVKSDDGFLVLDRNGNGRIDDGSELFGADTLLANGQKATSGFEALRDLDSNGDGVFNAADTRFADVRVWRDLNQMACPRRTSYSPSLAWASPRSPSLPPTPRIWTWATATSSITEAPTPTPTAPPAWWATCN